jgi:uncharacterized RDD family membrane protein YckC
MQYEATSGWEDTVRIATPEGVELELELAGVGSRLIARLIDVLIQLALTAAVFLVLFRSFDDPSGTDAVGAVVGIVLAFVIFWGYNVVFEAFNNGQTPGKRLNDLRVVGERGEPVSFVMAAVRNIMRIVDELLTFFMGALISMVRSPRNQRLGDLAAGTLVVRERKTAPPAYNLAPDGLDQAERWDTSAISEHELLTVRQFLERRDEILPHARSHLAAELAGKLRPKVPGADSARGPEQFLELLVAVKARRR